MTWLSGTLRALKPPTAEKAEPRVPGQVPAGKREPRKRRSELTSLACRICKRELGLECFITITERKRRGDRIYEYVKPSYDCRECSAEQKREQRRRSSMAKGKTFEARGRRADWETLLRQRREKAKIDRRVAWAVCRAFRTLVSLSTEEKRARAAARTTARQRYRYNNEPAYQAKVKAKKLRRKHAIDRTKVEPVNREEVAVRDGWQCAICRGRVTRGTWSLDHVVPLSHGGPHTYGNVVLAHRSCNSRRGAGRFPVQAPLFARPTEVA